MLKTPFVSVIIPTYNRAHFVGDAIKSVLNQDVVDCFIEIIVVDDGSTDNTRQVVSSFGKKVKYIFQDNKGPGAARNRGIDEASGDWIAFLDSDDLWLPDKLSLQFKVLAAFPQYKAIHSNFYTTKKGEVVIKKGLELWIDPSEYNKNIDWNKFYSEKYNSNDFLITRSGSTFDIYAGNIFGSLVRYCLAATWTLLVKRECLLEHIRFHKRSPRNEDLWFICQLCEYENILFMDCPTVENRGHAGDRLTKGNEDKALECVLDIYIEIFIPSASPFRPDDEVIFRYYKKARNYLLKLYLKDGKRIQAEALIKTSNDIVGFDHSFIYTFYRIVVSLPFDVTNRLMRLVRCFGFLEN